MTTKELIKLRQKYIEADALWYRLQSQQEAFKVKVKRAEEKQEETFRALKEAFGVWAHQGTVTE
jgi:adenylyl- and sulfurtransferase ThiI